MALDVRWKLAVEGTARQRRISCGKATVRIDPLPTSRRRRYALHMSDEQPSVISRVADGKPSQSSQSKLWGGGAALVGVVVWFAVGRIEPPVMAEAAGYSTFVMVFAGWLFWSRLSRRWFSVFMSAVVAIHGLALCAVPWPVQYETSKRDMIFLFADFWLMFGLGELVARLTCKPDVKA